VQEILPVARAELAKKLIDVYGLSQTEAAKKLGLSQPAISQYKLDIRGSRTGSYHDNQGFMKIVDDIAKRLAEGSTTAEQVPKEMCRLCRSVGP
jgi:predicted transcriptional regulator